MCHADYARSTEGFSVIWRSRAPKKLGSLRPWRPNAADEVGCAVCAEFRDALIGNRSSEFQPGRTRYAAANRVETLARVIASVSVRGSSQNWGAPVAGTCETSPATLTCSTSALSVGRDNDITFVRSVYTHVSRSPYHPDSEVAGGPNRT